MTKVKQDGFEPAKKAPGKKNTKKWCRGKVGVEHVTELRMARWLNSYAEKPTKCGWRYWKTFRHGEWTLNDGRYICWHERYCVNCGKVMEHLSGEKCPDYVPK